MYTRALDHDDMRFRASIIMADLQTVSTNQILSQQVPWFSRDFQCPPTLLGYHKAVSHIKTVMV